MKNPANKKKIKNILAGVLFIAVLCVVLYGVGYSTGFIQKNLAALTVGDVKVDSLEYRFYYTDTKNRLISEYGSYMQENGVDFSKPLESQVYEEGKTWATYLHEATVNELKEIYAIYATAQKESYVATQEIQDAVAESMAAVDEAAKAKNMTPDAFVKSIYGKHIGYDQMQEYMTRRYYAIGYLRQEQDGFTATDEEIKAYYEANKNDFDSVDYNFFTIDYEKVEGDDAKTEENKAAAKAKAEEMLAKVTTPETFPDLAFEYALPEKKPYYMDEAVTRIANGVMIKDAGPISDWYSSPDRVKGDKAVIEGTQDFTVILFNSRFLETYNSASVRHILITPEESHEGHTHDPITDEAKSAAMLLEEAKLTADAIYSEYLAGDKSEDSFAALATETTHDPGSVTTGGLYAEFGKNQMYKPFEDWSFNASNKPGDTGIIQSESGYHVMYFVGWGRPYWMSKAETAMAEKDFNEMFDKMLEGIEPKKNSLGMSFAF